MTAWRWDTGAQVHVGSRFVDATMSATTGSLSNPLVRDDNAGKQVSGRIVMRPAAGLVGGISLARGAYLSRSVTNSLDQPADAGQFVQRAVGFDVEYSRGHWIGRAEAILSEWLLPAVEAPTVSDPLGAWAMSVEGRYKVLPGFYVAARADRLAFSHIDDPRSAGATVSWDAPVTRVETGGGYYVERNLLAKIVFQHNWRDGGRYRTHGFAAAQLLYWF
jgi:hypothetical protein